MILKAVLHRETAFSHNNLVSILTSFLTLFIPYLKTYTFL